MKCHFSEYSFFSDKKERHPESNILDALKKTQYDLEIAYSGFNDALDPELIDCYIYELTALSKKYNYLLKQATRYQTYARTPSDSESSVCPVVSQALI